MMDGDIEIQAKSTLDKIFQDKEELGNWRVASLHKLILETNHATALKVLQSYKKYLAIAINQAELELKNNASMNIAPSAHRLKPSSQILGFLEFSDLCEQICLIKKQSGSNELGEDLLRSWIETGKSVLQTMGRIPSDEKQ